MKNLIKIATLAALSLAVSGNENCQPCDPEQEDAAPDEIAQPDDDDASDDDDSMLELEEEEEIFTPPPNDDDAAGDDDDATQSDDDDGPPNAPDCECDASINKVPGDPLSPGGQGSWLIYVDYFGADWCEDGLLCVEDVLPPGLSYAGWNGSAWTCTNTGSTVECCFDPALPTLPTTLLPLEILVDVDSTLEDSIENCAEILQGDDYFADSHEPNNSSCATADIPCGDLDESLDTGFDDTAATTTPPGALEDDWILVADGAGGVVPRAPIAVVPFGGWLAAMGSSSWLSPTENGPGVAGWSQGGQAYTYERCFCLSDDFGDVDLQLQTRADDAITAVRLNGSTLTPTSGTSGAFNDPTSLDFSTADPALFLAGENCVQIDVLDSFGVVTGLDVVGNITALDGLCCNEPLESDLAIDKTSDPSFTFGDVGVYSFTVENQGTATESVVNITDPLPDGMTFLSNTNPDWTCTAAPALPPQTVTCSYLGAPLLPGDTTSLDIAVQLVSQADWPGGDFAANCAQVSGSGVDTDPSDNLSCIETPVGCGDLDESLSTGFDNVAAATASPGDLDDDWNVIADAELGLVPRPADVVTTYAGWLAAMPDSTWVSTTTTGPGVYWPQSVEGGTYTYHRCWCIGDGATSTTFSASVRADNEVLDLRVNGVSQVNIGGPGTHATAPAEFVVTDPTIWKGGQNCVEIDVLNWSSVAGLNVDASVFSPDGACCDAPEPQEADLSIDKSHVGDFLYDSSNFWTIEVTNNGAATSTGMTVVDPLAPGYTFTGNSNTAEWSCTATPPGPPQTVTCVYIGPPLAAGGSSGFDLIVDVPRAPVWPNSDLVINCADVTGNEPDPDTANNQSCDPTIHVI